MSRNYRYILESIVLVITLSCPAAADVISQYTAGTVHRQNLYPGQAVTAPSGSGWDDVTFSWFVNAGGSPTPAAFGATSLNVIYGAQGISGATFYTTDSATAAYTALSGVSANYRVSGDPVGPHALAPEPSSAVLGNWRNDFVSVDRPPETANEWNDRPIAAKSVDTDVPSTNSTT